MAFLFVFCAISQVAAQVPLNVRDEPDDRLEPEARKLVEVLTREGLPELVDALLEDAPPMHRVHVARAFSEAGAAELDASRRETFYQRAIQEYDRIISLEKDRLWFRGARRQFDVALWRVELADLILRRWAATELDRFEITSGLDYDRRALSAKMKRALAQYNAAGSAIEKLRTLQEERREDFVLLGLSARISPLFSRQRLNRAWCCLFLAMAGEVNAAEKALQLHEALTSFDEIARRSTDSDVRYNAFVGMAMALRESGRKSEARRVLDQVLASTAAPGLLQQARYENAKCLIGDGMFEEAREQLEALESRSNEDDTGASAFYQRLAPVISAYVDVLEAKSRLLSETDSEGLRIRAAEKFEKLAAQGGSWTEIARIYLDEIAGRPRALDELGDAELASSARRWMDAEKYAEAATALDALIKRGAAHDTREARFNRAVCWFQIGRIAEAGEEFMAIARATGTDRIIEQAGHYAYVCRQQAVKDGGDAEAFSRLGEAASLLVSRWPNRSEAVEAQWVAGLAYQEALDFESAMAAYGKLPASHPQYWNARRNMAVCLQEIYTRALADTSAAGRLRMAQTTVDAWIALAESIANEKGLNPSQREKKIREARICAARILAGDDLRAYDKAMRLLEQLSIDSETVPIRMQCHRAQGNLIQAAEEIEAYIKKSQGEDKGSVLLGVASRLHSDLQKLAEHTDPATLRQKGAETAAILKVILGQVGDDSATNEQADVVSLELANALMVAAEFDEAMKHLVRLMSHRPDDGDVLRTAALCAEQAAEAKGAGKESEARKRAEGLWARLLHDAQLREKAPARYWEARYYWYRHQLRDGRASDVRRGIETERAWFPDLGGPPWQERILNLLAESTKATDSGSR